MARFVIQHRVPWPDVDLAGLVYFARYLSYFELAELEWVRSHGTGYVELLQQLGIWMPRVAAHCNYRAPGRLDDLLSIEMKLDQLGKSSFTLGYEIFRLPERHQLADGYIVLVAVSRESFKPVRLPDRLTEMLLRLGDEKS